MASPQQQRESRFRHLLQPLRELADNYSIDIAKELEDYLEKLETIQVSLDGGKTSVNFAEAALLIQGSACIYSKKVEFLYSLVFHTLDMVTAQKRSAAAAKSSVGPTGEDADILIQEEEFLELDDVLKEGTNIDLVEDSDGEETGGGRRTKQGTPRERLAGLRMEQALGGDAYRVNSCALAHDGTLMLDVGTPGLLSLSPIRAAGSPGRRLAIATPALMQSVMSPGGDGDSPGGSPLSYGGAGASPVPPPEEVRVKQARGESKGSGRASARSARYTNPWAQLDPHAVDDSAAKPFVKVRPPRMLANAAEIAKVGPKASRASNAPVLSASFAEFDYIVKRERQRISKKRFSLVQSRQSRGLPSAAIAYSHEEGGDDDDDGPMFDYGGGDDGGGLDVEAFMQAGHEAPQPVLSARQSLESAFQAGNISVSYEDLVKKHIESFMRGAEQYAVETQLTRRVAEWTDRIEPVLAQEEKRPEFNIMAYGSSIIHKLEEIEGSGPVAKSKKATASALASAQPPTCEFRELASDAQPFDVCRTFLACLQLANDGNVEICSAPADSAGLGTFGVKLLHSERPPLTL